jgi:hypothetical protein
MDSDDICCNNRFKEQISFLESNSDYILCGSWAKIIDSEKIIKTKEFHDEIVSFFLISNSIIHPTVMLKKESIIKLKYDLNKFAVEDYDLWTRLYTLGKFYNIQKPLLFYRIHNNQISVKFKDIQIKGDITIKLNLFKKLNYNESLFPDSLIIKILYSNDLFSIKEFKLILLWFIELKLNNIKFKVFDNKYFLIVLNKINKNLFYKIFMTSEIKGIDYQFRIKLFKELPFQFKLYIFSLKMKEKYKFMIKK